MAKKPTREQLLEELQNKESEIKNLNDSLINKNSAHKNEMDELKMIHEKEIDDKNQEYAQEKETLENTIIELNEQNDEKQRQLNIRELKKLAAAYKDQENDYRVDSNRWFKYVIISFAILAISIFVSFLDGTDDSIVKKIEIYLINFVFITFLVFALRQYSYYVKLRTDFANRKTLAQSYHNILTSSEDDDMKQLFLNKATDVLCAKNEIKSESYTLPEKIIEAMTEFAKKIK